MDGEKMEKLKLVGIVGTNAEKSTNRTLLKFMQKHFATRAELTLIEVKDLPFFDKPASHEAPAAVVAINQAVAQADGVIIATPEYDHTIPAPLTNLLEWFAYTAKPLQDKPVMIVGGLRHFPGPKPLAANSKCAGTKGLSPTGPGIFIGPFPTSI